MKVSLRCAARRPLLSSPHSRLDSVAFLTYLLTAQSDSKIRSGS